MNHLFNVRSGTRAALAAAMLLSLGFTAQAAEGEIRKLDNAQGKVTIRHGAIPSLDMPPMTMVYRARTPALLQGLAEGDRVNFEAEKVDGQYLLVSIQKR
jgi:Cu(I)/Ag(I) efflux system protein CusF